MSSVRPPASKIRITSRSPLPFSPVQTAALSIAATIVVLGTVYSLIQFSSSEIAFRTRFPSSVQHASVNAHFVPKTTIAPYFADKRNVFNQWFVKKAWGWTTLAVGAHLVASVLGAVEREKRRAAGAGKNGDAKGSATGTSSSSNERKRTSSTTSSSTTPSANPSNPAQTQALANIIASNSARPIFRWLLATIYWLLFTRWFFGPSFSDRIMTLTGGECIPSSHSSAFSSSSEEGTVTPASLDAALCRAGAKTTLGAIGITSAAPGSASASAAAKPYWKGGHDVSGHVFLLTHASVYLLSAVGPVLPYLFGNPQESPLSKRGEHERRIPTTAQKATAWAVLALVGLWFWMLAMTSVYFHTPAEKISGLLVAVGGVLVQAVAN